MGGLSLWHWLIVLVIVVLVFGTKRLKNVGQDLGEAVKGFKKGMHDEDESKPQARLPDESRNGQSAESKRRFSSRCSAGYSEPCGTCTTSRDTCCSRCAIA